VQAKDVQELIKLRAQVDSQKLQIEALKQGKSDDDVRIPRRLGHLV